MYQVEYEALSKIAAHADYELGQRQFNDVVISKLDSAGFIETKRISKPPPSRPDTPEKYWIAEPHIKVSAIGLDALAAHEDANRRDQELQREHDRVKRRTALRDAAAYLAVGISLLVNWNAIVAWAVKVWEWAVSFFQGQPPPA